MTLMLNRKQNGTFTLSTDPNYLTNKRAQSSKGGLTKPALIWWKLDVNPETAEIKTQNGEATIANGAHKSIL